MDKICIKDIILGKDLILEGAELFNIIDKHIQNEEMLTISFRDFQHLTPSSMNMSLGIACDKYGLSMIRKYIKIVEISSANAETLSIYLKSFGENRKVLMSRDSGFNI